MATGHKRITILDIARQTGLSKSTVSRALGGDGDVSADAQERVTAAAKRLNYTPSVVARSLRSQRSHALGLIIPDIANPFFPEVVRGAQDVADARGYTVVLANSDWQVARERRYLDFARRYHLDGLIINPVAIPAAELRRVGCPIVVIGSHAAYEGFDRVASNTRGSIATAIDNLIARGHRRIALAAGPQGTPAAELRVRAFRDALAAHGLPASDAPIAHADFSREGGAEAAQRLFVARPRPTAVVCGNDLIALGALGACRDAGVRVPEDLSLIGIDNIEASATTYPPLTTVGKDKRRLGQRAAELLIDRIEGKLPPDPIRETLATTLIERSSVAPPRSARRNR